MQNMFKVNNRSTRHSSGIFIVCFEYIWHVVLVYFLLLWILKWQMEYFVALISIYLCISQWDLGDCVWLYLLLCFIELPLKCDLVKFKRKLYETQSTTVSSHYLFFVTKNSILDNAQGLTWILWHDPKKF